MLFTGARFGSRPVKYWAFLLAWTIASCTLVVGCGGSSGGGDGGSSPGLTYSGVTTQAVITSENSQTLAENAMNAGAGGSGISGIAGLDAGNPAEDGTGRPFLVGMAMVMESAIAEVDWQSDAGQVPSSAIESDADTVSGSCGGSFTYNIQVDTDTGTFSGRLAFNSFCEEGMTMSGSANFSGVVDLGTEKLESCTVSFNAITSTYSSVSVTMGGRIHLAVSGPTSSMTMDMMVRDDGSGRVCKIENYQMDITDWGTYAEITLNGRYFDPDYGYVELETTTAFVASYADEYPHTGQLVLTGENGDAGGPTRARLTALSATECQVEADTNGDGIYDHDSGVILWTEL